MKRPYIKVPNCENGRAFIEYLRTCAKAHNLTERAKALLLGDQYTPIFCQVALFGRLGKSNPNSYKYAQRGMRRPTRIKLQDSAEIAVYLNPVKRSAYGLNLSLFGSRTERDIFNMWIAEGTKFYGISNA